MRVALDCVHSFSLSVCADALINELLVFVMTILQVTWKKKKNLFTDAHINTHTTPGFLFFCFLEARQVEKGEEK